MAPAMAPKGILRRQVNVPALIFLVVSATAVMFLRRELAPIPLLASCCYMTLGQGIDFGPVSLPVYRLILAIGLLRVLVRREALAGGLNAIDKLMIVWALWMVFAGFFHIWGAGSGPIYASGFVYNVLLVYLLTRAWCKDLEELMALLRIVAWLLVPVAIAMVTEHLRHVNYFGAMFGGVMEGVYVRDGQVRAQGPFAHPILAGTVGAVCIPLMMGIWKRYRLSAMVGTGACILIVIASTSSGPLVSLIMALLGLLAWSIRTMMPVLRWGVLGAYLSAEMLMTRPAYYLISEIDLTGSSTGWHRSHLIQQAIGHLSEWWAFGTDRTAHWMPYSLDGRHADITNYYLWIGVIGGLPAMLALIAIMWRAFVWVGESMRSIDTGDKERQFMIWCLGAGLFAHAGTSFSVAYFDQTMLFFWLNIGVISALHGATRSGAPVRAETKGGRGRLVRRRVQERERLGRASPLDVRAVKSVVPRI